MNELQVNLSRNYLKVMWHFIILYALITVDSFVVAFLSMG